MVLIMPAFYVKYCNVKSNKEKKTSNAVKFVSGWLKSRRATAESKE